MISPPPPEADEHRTEINDAGCYPKESLVEPATRLESDGPTGQPYEKVYPNGQSERANDDHRIWGNPGRDQGAQLLVLQMKKSCEADAQE
jgi:hypothetical protein